MVSVGRDDEAAKKAAAVRARLAAGEDFAKVAAEVSAGASKANGGLIGPIAATELSQDLQKTLEAMKPGDITQPLRSSRGYQILKLETIKPAGVRSFDSVRDLVADRVYQQRASSEMRKFLDRVRRQAIIVWKNEELRKAYRAVPSPTWTRTLQADPSTPTPVVRDLDPLPARTGRPRANARQGLRGLPADDRPLEPVEGSEEEGRLAALSGLLLRAVRPEGTAADPDVRRRRQHRLVQRRDCADSGTGDRRHPPACRERPAVRSVPAHPRGDDGRGDAAAR